VPASSVQWREKTAASAGTGSSRGQRTRPPRSPAPLRFAGLTAFGVGVVDRGRPLLSRRLSRPLEDRGRSKRTPMADIKFSCPHCGQHISCEEVWSGHQIQCPACQNNLMVPHAHPPPAAAVPGPVVPEPQAPSRSRLAAGSRQAARPAAAGTVPQRQRVARPPKGRNSLLQFAVSAVVLGLLGWAGFVFLPPLFKQVHEVGTSIMPANTSSGGGGGGPLGEMNGAMDVSDTLDGNSPSRSRAGTARRAVPAQPPATPATNSVPGSLPRRLR